YEALVSVKGSSSAGDIIKISNLHRNIVYDALSHLEKKGLVQETRKDKKKFFSLIAPEKLKNMYTKQLEESLRLEKLVAKLPMLANHEVKIYEGSRAWQEAWQNVMASMKKNSSFYTLGMAGDPWVRLMGETFVEYERWAEKNNILDKIISQKYLQKEIESHQSANIREIKYIDIDLEAHVSIEIFPDRVFFEIYDEPETLIEIKSISLVKSLSVYFNLLWNSQK
ncbi:MAG: helix-turn-helix domain-containing protein, partial [Minisyncoccia bacterium]